MKEKWLSSEKYVQSDLYSTTRPEIAMLQFIHILHGYFRFSPFLFFLFSFKNSHEKFRTILHSLQIGVN